MLGALGGVLGDVFVTRGVLGGVAAIGTGGSIVRNFFAGRGVLGGVTAIGSDMIECAPAIGVNAATSALVSSLLGNYAYAISQH